MNTNEFEERFSLEPLEAIEKYDKLIEDIGATKKGIWNIDSIKNYINIVFQIYFHLNREALWSEGDKYAIFNTGLIPSTNFTDNYVYCIGKVVEDKEVDEDKYKFLSFETEEKCITFYKIEEDRFKDLRTPKSIFLNGVSTLTLDGLKLPDNFDEIEKAVNEIKQKNKQKSYAGWPHIVIDGCDNLPQSLLKHILPDHNDKNKSVRDRLLHGDSNEIIKRCKLIHKLIESAFEKSKDDKEIIAPYFYPFAKSVNYALPLYIGHDLKPDCVMVFDQKGCAKTLLKMYEIRQNLRILALDNIIDRVPWLRE